MIVDDHPSVAIQNLSARREHGDGFNAVLERALLINFRIANLQIPEAGDQEQEYGDGGVLKKSDLLRRELCIVAQQRVGRTLIVLARDVKFHFSRLLSVYPIRGTRAGLRRHSAAQK